MNTEYYKTQLKLLSRQATNDIPKASVTEAFCKIIECCEFVLDRLEVQQQLLDILVQQTNCEDCQDEAQEECALPHELANLFQDMNKLVESLQKLKSSP